MMNFSKSLYSVLILVTLIFLVANCKKKEEEKKPLADFTSDKSEYFAGEVIHLINNSSDADTYRWTMPDGQTVKTENADYTSDVLMGNGTLSFKLEVFSKSGNKSDLVVKNIPIKTAYGQLIVYPKGNGYSTNFKVSADGQPDDNYSTLSVQQAPECGESGFATYNLTVGSHAVVIKTSSQIFYETINITANNCVKYDFLAY